MNPHAQFVEILALEAEAIAAAARRLDPAAVARAVEVLAGCRGKVVALGVGKSGDVARKAAATLTSTGTPAVFLHPSDAAHGGLGLVLPDDVVLAFSNSGETEELVALLPHLEHRGVPAVVVVGNTDSTLARRAAAVLDASVSREACPLNLAPTASTTVAMAVGDALALVLMRAKGVRAEDFALNHPAGRLGKRLTLRVRDLMRGEGDDCCPVGEEATLLEVVQAITRGGAGAVCVVGADERLAGVITDGDVRRTLERRGLSGLETLRAADVMTRGPVVVGPDVLAYAALRLMEERPSQISVLPVVEGGGDGEGGGGVAGLLRLHDIVRSGV